LEDYRPAVFDDIPAGVTMETAGTGTRYVFTALHRNEADFEKNQATGWRQGTEIAVDRFVAHVTSMKYFGPRTPRRGSGGTARDLVPSTLTGRAGASGR
jgi:hypothetical protein